MKICKEKVNSWAPSGAGLVGLTPFRHHRSGSASPPGLTQQRVCDVRVSVRERARPLSHVCVSRGRGPRAEQTSCQGTLLCRCLPTRNSRLPRRGARVTDRPRPRRAGGESDEPHPRGRVPCSDHVGVERGDSSLTCSWELCPLGTMVAPREATASI